MKIRKILIIAALSALPIIGGASEARAEDYCREYSKTVSINGKPERAYGKACRRSDGSWEIVDLEGSTTAREKIRDNMYDDIEHEADRRGDNKHARIIVVDNSHDLSRSHRRVYRGSHDYRYKHRHQLYNPYYRSSHVSYSSWPFIVRFGDFKPRVHTVRGKIPKRESKHTKKTVKVSHRDKTGRYEKRRH